MNPPAAGRPRATCLIVKRLTRAVDPSDVRNVVRRPAGGRGKRTPGTAGPCPVLRRETEVLRRVGEASPAATGRRHATCTDFGGQREAPGKGRPGLPANWRSGSWI